MWAYLLRSMWDLPGPGIKPVSLSLAGGLLSTEPPGTSLVDFLILVMGLWLFVVLFFISLVIIEVFHKRNIIYLGV